MGIMINDKYSKISKIKFYKNINGITDIVSISMDYKNCRENDNILFNYSEVYSINEIISEPYNIKLTPEEMNNNFDLNKMKEKLYPFIKDSLTTIFNKVDVFENNQK